MGKRVVNSKIENTTPNPTKQKPRTRKKTTKAKVQPQVDGIVRYRLGLKELGVEVTKFILKRCDGNLLTAKIALMHSLRELEGMIKDRSV